MTASSANWEQASLKRALERRFGASIMPYAFRVVRASEAGRTRIIRCTDTESGSWVEGNTWSGRLVVTASHDGAA